MIGQNLLSLLLISHGVRELTNGLDCTPSMRQEGRCLIKLGVFFSQLWQIVYVEASSEFLGSGHFDNSLLLMLACKPVE